MTSTSAGVGGLLRAGPAAVLMVDVARRQVVHVNEVAEELAPGTKLPIGLDQWSDAAQLRDALGVELSETDHPLSRVARYEPVDGQVVSAARRSALGDRREPLWVVAVPMQGAPMLEEHSLVVLIPLADAHLADVTTAGPVDSLDPQDADTTLESVGRELRDRALGATALSFTVADALHPETPLIWVNPAFTATTGYSFDDAVGRNCRFLRGPDTDPDSKALFRDAIERGVSTSITLLNYRKDGTPFWNQVDLSPVHDADGRVAHFVGIQTDVTERVKAELRTRQALLAEREARADAEAARTRLSFLVEAVNRLNISLDVPACSEELLSLVVPYLADWALLLHDDDLASMTIMRGRHRDPGRQAEVDDLAHELRRGLHPGDIAEVVLQGAEFRVIRDLASPASHEQRAGYLRDLSLIERTGALDGGEALMVGLSGRNRVRDVLVLVRTVDRLSFNDADVTTALDLARRAGLIFENASLYQAQARIADVLQKSLLPDLPAIAGIRSVARYHADERRAEVGGDFYELLDFHEDGFAFAVGDVTGHDILAAAAMGHLKGLLRASAHDLRDHPAQALEHVQHLMTSLGMPTIATCLLARVRRHEGGWQLRYSSAGHPPLALRLPDGTARVLDPEDNDTLLGFGVARTEHDLLLPQGTIVVGYTDGLVERRGEPLDIGLERLRHEMSRGPGDLYALCDHLIATQLGDRTDDDVALLGLQLE